MLSFFMTVLGRTLQLQQRGPDGKCMIIPPSSAPDLAPCDFHLFSRMKRLYEDNILAQ